MNFHLRKHPPTQSKIDEEKKDLRREMHLYIAFLFLFVSGIILFLLGPMKGIDLSKNHTGFLVLLSAVNGAIFSFVTEKLFKNKEEIESLGTSIPEDIEIKLSTSLLFNHQCLQYKKAVEDQNRDLTLLEAKALAENCPIESQQPKI